MSTRVFFGLIALVAIMGVASASMNIARVASFENGTDTVVFSQDYFEPIFTYNDTTMGVAIVVAPRTSKLALRYIDADLVEYDGDWQVFEVVTKAGKPRIYALDGKDNSVVLLIGLSAENVSEVASRVTLL
jgi:hypothetical protein